MSECGIDLLLCFPLLLLSSTCLFACRRGDLGDPYVERCRLLRQMTELSAWLVEAKKWFDCMLSDPLGADVETVNLQVQLHVGPGGFMSQLEEKRLIVERMLSESEGMQNGADVLGESDRTMLNSISQVREELRQTWAELTAKSHDWSKQLNQPYAELELFQVGWLMHEYMQGSARR